MPATADTQGKQTTLHTNRTQDKTYFIEHKHTHPNIQYTNIHRCYSMQHTQQTHTHTHYTLYSALHTHTPQCLHSVSVIACRQCRAQHPSMNPRMTWSRQPSTSRWCLSVSAQPEVQSHTALLQPSEQGPEHQNKAGLMEKLSTDAAHTLHTAVHVQQRAHGLHVLCAYMTFSPDVNTLCAVLTVLNTHTHTHIPHRLTFHSLAIYTFHSHIPTQTHTHDMSMPTDISTQLGHS